MSAEAQAVDCGLVEQESGDLLSTLQVDRAGEVLAPVRRFEHRLNEDELVSPVHILLQLLTRYDSTASAITPLYRCPLSCPLANPVCMFS